MYNRSSTRVGSNNSRGRSRGQVSHKQEGSAATKWGAPPQERLSHTQALRGINRTRRIAGASASLSHGLARLHDEFLHLKRFSPLPSAFTALARPASARPTLSLPRPPSPCHLSWTVSHGDCAPTEHHGQLKVSDRFPHPWPYLYLYLYLCL
jgi:hypothetical protein